MIKKEDGYSLVRLADSIPNRAVLSYDAHTDMIVDSGLKAQLGGLEASAGTVSVGLQGMSSAGEQVLWKNKNTQVSYAPPWHVIDEVTEGGSKDRYYEELVTVPRLTVDTGIISNPEFPIHLITKEVVFRIILNFTESNEAAEFRITQNNHELWREVKAVSAGVQEVTLTNPVALYSGDYVVSIKSLSEGKPVKLRGNVQTGEIVYTVIKRDFTEKALATLEQVQQTGDTKGDSLTAEINYVTQRIQLRLMSAGKALSSPVIDLAPLLIVDTQTVTLRYGFTPKELTDALEEDVVAGKIITIVDLDTAMMNYSRDNNTNKYIWMWIPTSIPEVLGFKIGPFICAWKSKPITVEGIEGNLFISPSKTHTDKIAIGVAL